MTKVASNIGGSQALQSVLEHTVDLLSHGYTLENIVLLAARIGGSRNVRSEETLMNACAIFTEGNTSNNQHMHEDIPNPQEATDTHDAENDYFELYDEIFACLDDDNTTLETDTSLPTSTPSHEHVSSPQEVNNIRKEYDELFECLDADVALETGNPYAFFQHGQKRPHHLITDDNGNTPYPNASMGA